MIAPRARVDGRAPFLVSFVDPTVPGGTRVVAFWNNIILTLMEKVDHAWIVVSLDED
jgi:hypothetical protein